ncbi:MAG: MAPEG family protein [Gammaproteobacteria bacterium]|nr:MAPEG family protein [Gammaproteobacteria bacterium]MDH5650589.1 MAPEG family protein [Gammaproteobacteria bacterium]
MVPPFGLPITSLVALPLTLLIIGLAYRVVLLRRSEKVGVGSGNSKPLALAMAAHSNAIENVPLALILFAMAEFKGVNSIFLLVTGILFVIGRGLNAWGVGNHANYSVGRYYGTVITWLIMIVLAVLNFWLVVS